MKNNWNELQDIKAPQELKERTLAAAREARKLTNEPLHAVPRHPWGMAKRLLAAACAFGIVLGGTAVYRTHNGTAQTGSAAVADAINHTFGFAAYAADTGELRQPKDSKIVFDTGSGAVQLLCANNAENMVGSTMPLGFNLQMIEDANLEDPRDLVERGEWTWEKFREYCKVLTKDTDGDGFDVLARVMYGGRISLMVGFVVVFLEILLGVIMGGLAGYYGGWVDNLIMRLVDIFYCLPSMPIMIILGAMMDALRMNTYVRLMIMMAALGIMGWAGVARMVRGQILSLREQEFMVATEATGIRVKDRIFRHLVPNVMPQLIVIASLGIGGTIITESTLSFLGLGVKHPLATWGTIINSVSSASAMAHYPFIWIPVGLLICMTVIAFNFVGDGLRDAYDPKAKR